MPSIMFSVAPVGFRYISVISLQLNIQTHEYTYIIVLFDFSLVYGFSIFLEITRFSSKFNLF